MIRCAKKLGQADGGSAAEGMHLDRKGAIMLTSLASPAAAAELDRYTARECFL